MNAFNHRNKIWVLLMVMMAACTTQPMNLDTPTKQIAAAEATLTGIYITIADLKTQGTITAEQKDRLIAAADKVHDQLVLAKSVVAQGVPQNSLQAILLLNQSLLELQKQLQEAEAKP